MCIFSHKNNKCYSKKNQSGHFDLTFWRSRSHDIAEEEQVMESVYI